MSLSTLIATDWKDAADAGREELVALRRAIHAEPELGLDCPRTRDKLEAALAGLPLSIRRSEKTSGFVATLEGARPGRTVLLRGDMDALPIQEATGLDFASRGLSVLRALPHVGDVLSAEDTEQVMRLFRTLRQRITTDATIPMVFDSMALTWSELDALRSLIRQNCADADSTDFRTNPAAHRTCTR